MLSKRPDRAIVVLTMHDEEYYLHEFFKIGDKLHISERTVETHRSHIFEKLGISNRAELVRFAIDNGIMKV